MANKTFTIQGAYHKIQGSRKATKCFPSLNNLLNDAECSPYKYNDSKRKYMDIARRCIRRDLGTWKPSGRVRLYYEFGEPKDGHYRDYDNISAAAHKFINDALVKQKVIHDDSPKYLLPSLDKYVYTDGNPYIKVTIVEE